MATLFSSLIGLITFAVLWYGLSVRSALYARKKAARLVSCQPPPSIEQRDPIFGLDVILQLLHALKGNHRNMSIVQMFSKYGRTFQSHSWGSSTIYTIEPQNLRSIFSTDFDSWGLQPMRLFAFEPFVGKGIMCTDGQLWEHSRALIKPTIARAQIADLHLSTYATHVQRFLDLIPKDGSGVDLQPLFGRLALDSSTEFLFGESVGSLQPDSYSIDARNFLKAYNHGQTVVGKRLHLPQWNFLTQDKHFWNSCKIAHDFITQHIRRAQQSIHEGRQERRVLIHDLVEGAADVDRICNELSNVFLPAHEATGVALTNMFFHLARNPDVYQKLRQEIKQAGKGQAERTFDRLKGLKYLQQVINETLRLNPPIGTNTRMALCDTILPTGGGQASGRHPIYVTKGDTITVSFYALHRRQEVFGQDACVFRPERWEKLRIPPWSYLPFGGGPRVCPGQNLALTEIAYTTVRILETFGAIRNRDPILKFVEVYQITTSSRNGARVSLLPD